MGGLHVGYEKFRGITSARKHCGLIKTKRSSQWMRTMSAFSGKLILPKSVERFFYGDAECHYLSVMQQSVLLLTVYFAGMDQIWGDGKPHLELSFFPICLTWMLFSGLFFRETGAPSTEVPLIA
jgi:hypothetical protein